MPKVSIITAAYNHVSFVRDSVESAQNQTYRDFEHIVVDDGSTDGTAEVLQSFGNRINYIRQENRGTHSTINAAIRASAGEYIAILDSDDAWLPQKLERQMPVFDQCPGAGMVYSQAYLIDAHGALADNGQPAGTDVGASPYEALLKEICIPVLTAVIRRKCFDEIGFFDEHLKALSDWEFWLRLSLKWPIVFIPEPLAMYRVHEHNTFSSLSRSGHVTRERLSILKNAAAALSGTTREGKSRKRVVNARFAHTLLRDVYGLTYRRHFYRASRQLLFGLRLSPACLKDLPAAIRLEPKLFQPGQPLRLVKKLIFGNQRLPDPEGIEIPKSVPLEREADENPLGVS